MAKRYYWLKLQENFFNSKRIKKLRRISGGDTFTIIYLKMQLLALKTDGVLEYTGLEESFAKELALDIDEEPDNVAITVQYLLSCGLMETDDDKAFVLPFVLANTGSESASAERVRNHRERLSALHCNADVTQVKRLCNVEIEIEKEKDLERDNNKRSRAAHPTVEDVAAYCKERGNNIDAERFVDYYSQQGWKLSNGNAMKDWRAAVRNWERRDPAKPSGGDRNSWMDDYVR